MTRIPAMLNMISELIAAPSVSCADCTQDQSNKAMIDILVHWCQNLGFNTKIMPIPGHPGKFNLLATLGSGAGGLVLAGHTDTVPYDLAHWQYDPFRLTVEQNRLYGLGTCDMKTFFALALSAVAQLLTDLTANNKPVFFNQPLILLATADEESTMSGAKALVKAGQPKARHAVIGEPTNLRPVRMHKGIFMEAIKLRGHSGHSSNPALGNSALEGMQLVIRELLAWRRELQAKHVNPLFEVPVPTLNLGHIHGGDSPNRICADCELHLDLRPLPGMALEELRELLQQRVQSVVANRGLTLEFASLFEGVPATETPAQAEIVKMAETLTEHSAQAVDFCTEAPYLNALGMETVILGPGNIAQAHQANEFVELNRLQPMVDILSHLIRHFCMAKAT